jgi:inner membrane transporter RhtA
VGELPPTFAARSRSHVHALAQGAPEALFVVGAVSQYIGAAIAVGLFDELTAGGVAWLRVLAAAAIIIAVRRSWRRRWTRFELAWTCAFGVVLAAMNLTFYLAIDELPLGNAVAIEFIGPIAVAAIGTRTRRNGAALLMTVAGILLLAEVTPDATARGLVFILLAGVLWGGYIMLGHRVARSGVSLDGLGVGMAAGAVAILPFGLGAIGAGFDAPHLLLLAALTGLLSNALPYGIDQIVLARLPRERFALLLALLPVTATIIGLVSLGQRPTWPEVAGIAVIIGALTLSRRESAIGEPPAEPS